MKKTIVSFALLSLLSLSPVGMVTAQETASKVETLATVTENVLALTGTSTGNTTVDRFLTSTATLLQKYKTVNSTLTAFKVLKEGSATTITSNGKTLSKLAALGQLTGVSKQLTALGSETAVTATSGTNLLKSLVANKATEAVSDETMTKMETAVSALKLLGAEIPSSVETTATLLSALKK